MSPTLLRRAFLVTLVLGTAYLCFGCAGFPAGGYRWVESDRPKCTGQVTWKQVYGGRERGLCAGKDFDQARAGTSCVIGACLVISPYSEEQAKRIDLWGMSLWEHEVEMHARRGLVHPD